MNDVEKARLRQIIEREGHGSYPEEIRKLTLDYAVALEAYLKQSHFCCRCSAERPEDPFKALENGWSRFEWHCGGYPTGPFMAKGKEVLQYKLFTFTISLSGGSIVRRETWASGWACPDCHAAP